MSGVNGLFEANSPPGCADWSLHALGSPCPDSRTNTWKLCELPLKAIPVGAFRPEAKTDALNPGGRSMDGGKVGSKNAVLSIHPGRFVGFATVVEFDFAQVTVGSPSSGVSAAATVKVCNRFTCMA